ncbi:MAG: prolipoprotein diacylglyceryl transferase [Microgenomates group bacterium]|nr:prolipoprotein diacylglyceryl transferase [Microgenomates group bacterium]
MLPVLFTIGPIKIYTFGVFLVLAFFWGTFILWKLIRLTSFKEEEVFDGMFVGLIGALFFGRLFYVILNFKDFGFSFIKFILINGYPGLSLYGALFGGLIFLYFYFSLKNIKFLEVVDYFVPALMIALAFGKLGSFFSGVEVGTKTKFLFSIKYVGFEGMRHLTSFYEAMFFFLGLYLSYKILFEIRREKFPYGFNLKFFGWFFSLSYFLFDKIKANHLYLKKYNFNYGLSAILLLTFSFYFLYYFRSLIFAETLIIIKTIKNYGHKTFKKIFSQAKRQINKRKESHSKTDRRT